MKRRQFILGSAALVAAPSLPRLEERLCLFTDHLSGFEYISVARMLKELGIPGPDLTVRPGGLVRPERVREDLSHGPRASSKITACGSR